MKFFKRNATPRYAPRYYPNNIGLNAPGAESCYEFMIFGKEEVSAENKIIKVFLESNVVLLSMKTNVNPKAKEFNLNLCCDLDTSDLGPEDLARIIRKMSFVTGFEYSEMTGRMFSRLFPLTLHDSHRAVALSSDTMLKLGMNLAKEFGSAAASALYREGRAYASRVIEEIEEIMKPLEKEQTRNIYDIGQQQPSIEGYCLKCRSTRVIKDPMHTFTKNDRPAIKGVCPVCSSKIFKIGFRELPNLTSGALIENVQGFLMASGWGVFELRNEIEGKSGTVTIVDPPTLQDDISYGNQFVEGIASVLLEAICQARNRMELVGEKYDSENRILSLRFAEQVPVRRELTEMKKENGDNGMSSPIGKEESEVSEEEKQVETIINALDQIQGKNEEPLKIVVEDKSDTKNS